MKVHELVYLKKKKKKNTTYRTHPLSNVDKAGGCKKMRIVKDEGYAPLYFSEAHRFQLIRA